MKMKHNRILTVLLLLLFFASCEDEEEVIEDDSIYKEELFTANAWKLVSAEADYDLTGSTIIGSTIIGSVTYAGTEENLLGYVDECHNSIETTFLTTNRVQVQTGDDFCETEAANQTLQFASWSVEDDTLTVAYDQVYAILLESMYDTPLSLDEQELAFVELTEDKLVLELEVPEEDIQEYADELVPVGVTSVTGTMTITYTYEQAN